MSSEIEANHLYPRAQDELDYSKLGSPFSHQDAIPANPTMAFLSIHHLHRETCHATPMITTTSPSLPSIQAAYLKRHLSIGLSSPKIMDRTQHGARLLEELDLLHRARIPPEATSRRNVFCNWRWKVLNFLDDIRRRRSRCVVCLQIHQVGGLPSAMDGQVLVVGWKTKGCKGEHTLPVHVCEGIASFDEIFLHHCSTDVRSILRSFTIWVSLVDAADCDLGTFHVDLSELAMAGNLHSNFGGKSMSFILGGMASGGALNLSVCCRMLEEAQDLVGQKQNKSKFFACLPDLGCLRSRSVTVTARRVPSLRSERGFITIENSLPTDEEDGGFITMEKGTVCARSRGPPSDHLVNTDDESGGLEDEKPCLVTDEFDVEKVEDEFLRMLEEKYWKGEGGEVWKRGVEGSLSLSLDLSLDLDLDSLIKEAEMELTKAAQVWKSRAEAALLEKEEYEELLLKRWGSNENSTSGCSGGYGFGSPI